VCVFRNWLARNLASSLINFRNWRLRFAGEASRSDRAVTHTYHSHPSESHFRGDALASATECLLTRALTHGRCRVHAVSHVWVTHHLNGLHHITSLRRSCAPVFKLSAAYALALRMALSSSAYVNSVLPGPGASGAARKSSTSLIFVCVFWCVAGMFWLDCLCVSPWIVHVSVQSGTRGYTVNLGVQRAWAHTQ
jgi:hypothetical protein